VVRTSGRDLILAGRQPYSTLYAVYHLLERHLGCGFFEDGEQVPHRPTLQLPALKDVVDYGRTYLGAMFNDRLGRARKALRDKDQATFEKNAQEIEELMHFMARYCSAHPRLRLKTYDDWARQSPEVLPGYDNAESNWITFTALISPKYWNFLLDYMAEDLAELVEYYFWPRVRLYLEEMRKYVAAGQDISGRLTNRNSDQDMLYRVSDFVPPQGKLPWSPYGNTCEPELTAGNDTSPPLVLKDKGRRLS
jgi:hypothetical protein